MQDVIKVRPHHGMCIAFFRGKGYSKAFTAHMKEMVEVFTKGAEIELVLDMDEICTACPNNLGTLCETQEKVMRYDQGVLKACGLEENTVMDSREFLEKVRQEVILTGKRMQICGDCIWNEICENLEKTEA